MKKRQSQIELLRIVCMFMIVVLHMLGQGGLLYQTENFTANYYVFWFMEAIVYCAVNCFAMISGYVGYQSDFKIARWIQLWFQVVFYSVLCLLIFSFISKDNFSIDLLKKAIMPFTQSEYWYISAYAGLFFLIPVLNEAAKGMKQRRYFGSLLAVFLLYTIIPTIFHQDPFSLHYGYNVFWLCILYLTGAYFSKYRVTDKIGCRGGLILYFSCVLITWLGKILSETVSYKLLGEVKYGYVFIDYTTPFMVLEAIGLLAFFANLKIKGEKIQKIVCTVARASLGVYIIHVEPYVFYQIVTDCLKGYANGSVGIAVAMCLLYAIGIYMICTMIDLLRIKIFHLLHIPQLTAILEKKARSCFDRMCKKAGIDE